MRRPRASTLPAQQRRQRRRAARLQHELEALEREAHRGDDLGVGDGLDGGDALADHRERPRAGRVELLAVGDRAADRHPDALPGRERAPRVVAHLGLDADDAQPGQSAVAAVRAAGDQPAAADRHEQQVERAAVLDQLERRRPLAGHDPLVVVRVDEGEALALGPLGDQRLAVGGVAVEAHDPRAVALGRRRLGRRGVLGHQDRRRDARAARRSGRAPARGCRSRRSRRRAAGRAARRCCRRRGT